MTTAPASTSAPWPHRDRAGIYLPFLAWVEKATGKVHVYENLDPYMYRSPAGFPTGVQPFGYQNQRMRPGTYVGDFPESYLVSWMLQTCAARDFSHEITWPLPINAWVAAVKPEWDRSGEKNREYWRSILQRVDKEAAIYASRADKDYKPWFKPSDWIRQRRNELRHEALDLSATGLYGPEIGKWVMHKIRDIRNEGGGDVYECVDNIRFAEMGKASHVRRYRRQQKSGCCGSVDRVVVHPSGRTFMVGFNHGH